MPLTLPTYGPGLSPMCSIFTREGMFGESFSPGSGAGAPVSGIYDAAQRAFYYPIWLPRVGTAYKLWWLNGATAATDNVQVGVYADTGAGKPGAALIRGTSTLAAGANSVQYDNITDTQLGPGNVWLAIWASGVTTTLQRFVAGYFRQLRAFQESSLAGGLPATATPVGPTTNVFFPVFGIQFRSSP